MELDDLKSSWTQYDKKLSKNLELNEELLKKMNLKRSKSELWKPMMYEISGVVLMFVWIVVVAWYSFSVLEMPQFSVPGLFSVGIACIYLVFNIIKSRRFLSIDYYRAPVIQLQQDIAKVNELVLRYRKYELLLMPFILTPVLPLMYKVVHHIDVYSNPRTFWIGLILILGFGFPATFLVNKYLYDKKIERAQHLLNEIENYKLDK